MKILILDTYYPEVLRTLPFDENSTYEVELRKVLDTQFGTSDFYSKNLRALGHDCRDVIINHRGLSQMRPLREQFSEFKPDVVFLQDLNIEAGNRPPFIAAQLSCPWPGDDKVKRCDVIFTSFPHYVTRIEALGVRAVYLPLAFEPSVLEGPQPERDMDISFVGGVGRDLHWRQGTDVLEAVAAAFPDRFVWFGYGVERLRNQSPLHACYRGSAWGREQYSVYRRSKIVINRHGEVAEGFANNMRMYEATGCAALLMTEVSPNLHSLFPDGTIQPYSDPVNLCRNISWYLRRDEEREEIAKAGQDHVREHHTYAQRMKTISEVLTGMLCPA